MNSDHDPESLLPVKLWQLVAAHVDEEQTMSRLETTSVQMQNLIVNSEKQIFEESGAAKVLPLVEECVRLTRRELDYKLFAIHDTFNPSLFTFNDVLKKIEESNQLGHPSKPVEVLNIMLNPGQPSISAIKIDQTLSDEELFHAFLMTYSINKQGMPSWMPGRVRIKFTTLCDIETKIMVQPCNARHASSTFDKIGGPFNITTPSGRINVDQYEEICTPQVFETDRFSKVMVSARVKLPRPQPIAQVLLLLDFSAKFEIDEKCLQGVIDELRKPQDNTLASL